MKTDNETLVKALRILANDIQTDDGVANACIAEAALRIEELAIYAESLQKLAAKKACSIDMLTEGFECVMGMDWNAYTRDFRAGVFYDFAYGNNGESLLYRIHTIALAMNEVR